MKVSELVDGIARLIYSCRVFNRAIKGEQSQFLLGNLRFFDCDVPPFLPIPALDRVLLEVSVGQVPIEVWKIVRAPHLTEISDEGQVLIIIHTIYAYLVSSEEFSELKQWDGVAVRLVKEDPVSGVQWRSMPFSLADSNSEHVISFQCFTNGLWKSDFATEQQDRQVPGSGDREIRSASRSAAIPVGSGGSKHKGSYDHPYGLGQSSQSSLQVSQVSPAFVPQPGSLSSMKPGTSPGSFQGLRTPRTAPQLFPQLSNYLSTVRRLPIIDPDVAYDDDEVFLSVLHAVEERLAIAAEDQVDLPQQPPSTTHRAR